MKATCQINGCTSTATLFIRPRSGDFMIVIDPKEDEELVRLCEVHYAEYRTAGMGALLAQLAPVETVT